MSYYVRKNRALAAFFIVIGTSFYTPPAFATPPEMMIRNVTVVCANSAGENHTSLIGWDTDNVYFDGKGDIAKLFCEGGFVGEWTIYVSDDYTGPGRFFNNGLTPTPPPEVLSIGAPTNLVVTDSASAVTLSWTAPSDGTRQPERYAISFSADGGGWGIATGNVGDSNALNTTITINHSILESLKPSGTVWSFTIRSDNDTLHLYSANSNTVTLKIGKSAQEIAAEAAAAQAAINAENARLAAIAAEVARVAELARVAEIARVQALQAEAARQAAIAVQIESARQAAGALAAQQAAEALAAQRAEAARQAVLAAQAEAARVEAERQAAIAIENARVAELARLAEIARQAAAAAEKARQDAINKENERLAEVARQQAIKAEEERIAADIAAKKAEEERILAELARLEKEYADKIAQQAVEAEAARLAEQERIANLPPKVVEAPPLPAVEPPPPMKEPLPVEPPVVQPPVIEPPVAPEPPVAIADPADSIGHPPVVEPPAPAVEPPVVEPPLEPPLVKPIPDMPKPSPQPVEPKPSIPIVPEKPQPEPPIIPAEILPVPPTAVTIDSTPEQVQAMVDEIVTQSEGAPITAQVIADAGLTLADLPPDTPIEVRTDEAGNEVVVSAEVAIALVLLENPAELLTELFTNPANALLAIASIGADMSVTERTESEKIIVASVIVGQIAVSAATMAASTTTTRTPSSGGSSSGGGAASRESKTVRRRKP